MLQAIALLCFFASSNAASVPSFFTLCKLGDEACILSSAKSSIRTLVKGIPELGVKSLDPMNIPLVVNNEAGLQLKFKNTTMTGLSGCNVEEFKHDHIKKKQVLKATCDLSLTGDYELGGQLLILPVEGKGKYKIELRGVTCKARYSIIDVEKSGVTHLHISDDWRQNYKCKVNNGAIFHLENLFNGNKVLGDPVLDFLNTYWKDVMEEVAPPIVEAIVTQMVQAVDTLYGAVPAKDLSSHHKLKQ